MGRNVEIKAVLETIAATEDRVRALADRGPIVLRQVDTFYHAGVGRLKLREINCADAELIAYRREDLSDAKTSQYTLVPTDRPQQLDEALAMALGRRGVVRKTRILYGIGQTRVHLDEVEGLGSYLELEVVLEEGQEEAEGRRIARDIMAQLGVTGAQLVEGAYIDLLEGRPTSSNDR